jgi:hypothetical protein
MVTSEATDCFWTSVILVLYSHQIVQALFVAYNDTVNAQAVESALLLMYCMVSGFDVADRWKYVQTRRIPRVEILGCTLCGVFEIEMKLIYQLSLKYVSLDVPNNIRVLSVRSH